jgi:tripartite-type tricarboxylate transporter receptor subunit TctC
VPASDRPAPDLRRAINAQIGLLTADEFRSYVAAEIQRWKGVVEAANIRVE